jgi:hypothetical protein
LALLGTLGPGSDPAPRSAYLVLLVTAVVVSGVLVWCPARELAVVAPDALRVQHWWGAPRALRWGEIGQATWISTVSRYGGLHCVITVREGLPARGMLYVSARGQYRTMRELLQEIVERAGLQLVEAAPAQNIGGRVQVAYEEYERALDVEAQPETADAAEASPPSVLPPPPEFPSPSSPSWGGVPPPLA